MGLCVRHRRTVGETDPRRKRMHESRLAARARLLQSWWRTRATPRAVSQGPPVDPTHVSSTGARLQRGESYSWEETSKPSFKHSRRYFHPPAPLQEPTCMMRHNRGLILLYHIAILSNHSQVSQCQNKWIKYSPLRVNVFLGLLRSS